MERITTPLFDWRAHLEVHPAADLFPLMSEAELKELADDIKANWINTPIVIQQRWRGEKPLLLDGRNRLDALALLGWLLPPHKNARDPLRLDRHTGHRFESIYKFNSGDPYATALSLNIHRRHLTAEQKRDLIAKVLKAQPQTSNRQIAKTVTADHKTVGDVRRELESTGEIPQLDKTVGADGKSRKKPELPANVKVNGQAVSVAAFSPAAQEQIVKVLVERLPESPKVHVDVRLPESADASAEKRKADYAAAEVITIEDGLEPDEYRPSFLLRTADALAFAVYSGPVDAEVIAAAERVAAKWKKFAQELARRGADAEVEAAA
jgi:hypothetical protein